LLLKKPLYAYTLVSFFVKQGMAAHLYLTTRNKDKPIKGIAAAADKIL
jgi:hypothetical protein